MREVTSDYISQVKSGARQFGFYVNVYGNGPEPEALWLSDIISLEITRNASDQLQIGACMSDRLTLQTKATTLFNGRGKKIVAYYRCTAPILGWIRLGTFYVDECVTDQGVTAVTAYDMMSRLDKRISWGATSKTEALTFPCSMQDMLEYICARAGVTTDFTCQDITVEKPPDGYTARELISYIAASHGANARFSPSEVLRIRQYTRVDEVVQYGGCYSMDIASDSGYTVKGILFDRGGDDKIYIDDTAAEYDEDADGVVEAYNPFATVGIAEYAWSRLGGLSYSAVSLEMPAQNILEPGDVFTVQGADGTEKTAIVMEQTLSVSCTGGFVEAISCTAESKNQTRNAENRAEATEKEIQSTSGAALNEYEYISDLSVRCNGITYTAEKDADTGLLSRISDSNGNAFKPKINAGITDVALHNAVFWAVAMRSGLSGVSPPVLYDRGDLCEDITGGWEIVVRPNTAYESEFREDCIYLKTMGWTSGTINYNYIFAQTVNAIDLTAYRTLHITCKGTVDKYSDIRPSFGTTKVKITSDMTVGNGGTNEFVDTNGAERTIDLDISGITGYQHVYIKLAEYNTVYAYKIWAEL